MRVFLREGRGEGKWVLHANLAGLGSFRRRVMGCEGKLIMARLEEEGGKLANHWKKEGKTGRHGIVGRRLVM